MAAVARRHGIAVTVASFEAWDPSEPFDLLISAQAWHWVDPTIGVAKAGRVLRPGGRFAAFWNSYAHAPDVQAVFAEVYQRHAPEVAAGSVTAGTWAWCNDPYTAPLIASDLFEVVEQRWYPWRRVYSRDEWLDQLPTHSDHRTMAPETLEAVLAGVGAGIDHLGGKIAVDHSTRLITARRRS
jgi:SAM-dependent methyltransferase